MIGMSRGNSPVLSKQYLGNLVEYLKLTGWQEQRNPRWFEFFGPADSEGNPLLLVLPRTAEATDTETYIWKAVNLLSALSGETEETTARRVEYYYSDVFVVRNLETGSSASISLELADTQITELKRLVAFAARSEREPRPYFQYGSPSVKMMIEPFRFGHTLRQSFGLTVEAPILHDRELYVSDVSTSQLPLLHQVEDVAPEVQIVRPPLERRIIERIMRGLITTYRASQDKSMSAIVNGYGSGFNGNMCDAVVRIGKDEGPIEYRVLWSPKVEVAEDVIQHPLVRLDDMGYTLLGQAALEMKSLQPEVKRIRGIVTHIGSNIPPLSETDQGRQVIIKWIRDDSSRTSTIIVPLNKEQYLLAHDAHMKWATVLVTGIVVREGNSFRLIDATDFEVLNPDAFPL
ncbi:MAG: hypothetical protein U0X20_22170 [Caldilineaceae bacterium]